MAVFSVDYGLLFSFCFSQWPMAARPHCNVIASFIRKSHESRDSIRQFEKRAKQILTEISETKQLRGTWDEIEAAAMTPGRMSGSVFCESWNVLVICCVSIVKCILYYSLQMHYFCPPKNERCLDESRGKTMEFGMWRRERQRFFECLQLAPLIW